MREQTKVYKLEAKEDLARLSVRNNSKSAHRTPEQNEQARKNKATHYLTKWSEMLDKAETRAQRDLCKAVIAWSPMAR